MVRRGLGCLGLSILGLDQVTKYSVEQWLPVQEQQPLWSGVLTLTHVQNSGVALGWMEGTGPLVLLASLASVAALLLFWARVRARRRGVSAAFTAGMACFLAGSIGNTIDRLRLGHVIDFLRFPNGLVINVADIGIVLGVVLVSCALCTRPAEQPSAATP